MYVFIMCFKDNFVSLLGTEALKFLFSHPY